jgi:N-acetylglucosamine repressor
MSSIIQPSLLKRMTERRILELLQERGPSTRAELTRLSGISAPTVSRAVETLLASGLVEVGDAAAGAVGRPGAVVRLATEKAQVLGVVLDVRRSTIVSAGLDGKIHDEGAIEFATPATYLALIDSIVQSASKLMKRRGVRTMSLGMSIPGLINRREGKSVFSPNLHLTDGRSPDRDLREKLGVDCVMYQETHALCLGERMYNAAEAADDFAMLEMSTGLGLGVVAGGRLMEGHSGLAGELGHITVVPNGRLCGCGNHGCLETVATDSALAQLISERLGRKVDVDEVGRLLREGSLQAEEELRSVCEYLAIAIAAAINLLNPATLFVHGRLFSLQDGLFEMVCELTRRRALAPSLADCRILRSRWSKKQAAVAAAIHRLFDALGPLVDD